MAIEEANHSPQFKVGVIQTGKQMFKNKNFQTIILCFTIVVSYALSLTDPYLDQAELGALDNLVLPLFFGLLSIAVFSFMSYFFPGIQLILFCLMALFNLLVGFSLHLNNVSFGL